MPAENPGAEQVNQGGGALSNEKIQVHILVGGRWAIDVVSGWFQGEFEALGLPWLEHDERYRRSREFISILKGIWTQDNFSFKGEFYEINNFTLKPKPLQQPHPEIFQGRNSRAG